MNQLPEVGRFLVIAGTVVIVLGVVFLFADKLPVGRLPGDFRLGGDRFRVYIPAATCVLVSVLLTVLVNLFARR